MHNIIIYMQVLRIISVASMATKCSIILLVISISCLCSARKVYIQPSEGEHCPGTCYNINTFGKLADLDYFAINLTSSKLSVSCARFYSMQYANCFKPTPILTDGSTFLGMS